MQIRNPLFFLITLQPNFKIMRRLIIIFLVFITLSSCRKTPDLSELSSQFIVLTNYDVNADFKGYGTFVMPEYVGAISDNPKDSILSDELGDPILDKVRENLTARGYTEVDKDNNPDMGVAITALKNVTLVGGGYYPGGWWGYPGWGGCYWYYCGYYPGYPPYYPVYYTYTTGSVIVELVDLKNITPDVDVLDVLWTNWNGGALGETSSDLDNALNSIDQGFIQSPYLSAN
mgnify:CR=1 FL=1